jgi:hypothetical protein
VVLITLLASKLCSYSGSAHPPPFLISVISVLDCSL